jgi:hypothetical protein
LSNGAWSEPVESVNSPRKPRRWWLIGLIAAVPVGIVAVVYVIACWRAHAILRRAMEEIAERGEAVWFADLAQQGNDEALARGRALATLLNKLNRVPWELLGRATTEPLTDALAVPAQHAVDVYRPDMRAILRIVRQGECRFEYDYQTPTPYDILLPHAQYLHNAGRLLEAECRLALAKSNRKLATRCVRELLELDGVLAHDPFAVSQLVRKSTVRRSLNGLQAILGHEAASHDDLQWIDERLRSMELSFRLADCMRAERAAGFSTMENLGSPGMSSVLTDDARGVSHTKAVLLNHWWGSWLYRPRRLFEESVMLKTTSRLADLIDRPGPAATAQFAAASAPAHSDEFPVFQELTTHLDKLRENGLEHRQRIISARLALAVCRYRQRHGRLPDALDDLEGARPESLVGLFSGKPLVYQKSEVGFAIYDDLPDQGRFEVKLNGSHRDMQR